jgi:Flp pilus assembly protein TadG
MKRLTDMGRRMRVLPAACGGAISVEFALVASAILLVSIGAFDFGRFGLEHMRLSNAARAGVLYGVQDHSTAADLNGMIAATRADAVDTAGELSVTARQYCQCPEGGEIACTTTCLDGAFAPMHVEVSVQKDLDLWFAYPGVNSPIQLASTSSMRVR